MKRFDYDFLIIGGGAAGFVSAKLSNGLGKKTAIVEKAKIGGECTWFGCIPSKTLIKASKIASELNNLNEYGLSIDNKITLNTDNVMHHVREIVNKIYNSHHPDNFEKSGIKIIYGEPQFISNHEIKIDNKIISSNKFLISTGSSAFVPEIEGINEIPYLINDTFFALDKLPESIVVLGGGPIGIELSSAINRLGVNVTVLEIQDSILSNEDKELVEILNNKLKSEGLNILTNTKAIKFSKNNNKIIVTVKNSSGKSEDIVTDDVLITVGRKPNIKGLALENAGVEFSSKGIKTSMKFQTTAENIYACGDVIGSYQFSHIAEYQARIATMNAFLPVKQKADYKNIIWCTYTDPELAHAGLTEHEARKKYGNKIKVYKYKYGKIDRGVTDRSESGMSKVICTEKGDILGIHILGERAGEVIHEAQFAKSMNIPFSKIYSVIHAYPSFSDIIRQPAKLCYIDRLENSSVLKILKKLLF